MDKIGNVTKYIDSENRTWYHARQCFLLMGISWGGIKTMYSKGLEKEYKVFNAGSNNQSTMFLSEIGVFKLSAQGLTKESQRIFNHVASRYFMDFSLDEI